MSEWGIFFYGFILATELLLSLMGVWFVAVIPGMDRWRKKLHRRGKYRSYQI